MELKKHLVIFRSKSIRGSKYVRFTLLLLTTFGLIFMFRTTSDHNAEPLIVTSQVEMFDVKESNYEKLNQISDTTLKPETPKKKKKKYQPDPKDENDQSFNIAVQPLIHQTVNILDKYMDMDSQNYQAIRSMFLLWNPQSSKWAALVSGRYRELVEKRKTSPKDWYEEPARDKIVERTVELERCGCKRKMKAHTMITYEGEDHGGNSSHSACSPHSYYRGAKQKVLAFSFYGDPDSKLSKSRKYFEGIVDNLKLIPKYYDGWTLRVYYDLNDDHPLLKDLCDVACNDPNLDLCYVKKIPSLGDISKVFPMNWRFVPLLDPQVSHMVSRDLDSLISQREASAVAQWMKSDKAFHFMRDHPAHTIEILGSGWGARLAPLERDMIEEAFGLAVKDLLFWAPRHAYGPDQGFLKKYIWPWAKWSALSHDAYSCLQFPRTSPFPTQRENGTSNFVAAVSTSNDVLNVKCPLKCRPKEHQDWEYC